ncbi:hypothetical protein TNCV_3574981 [Trichonephila clavipes]|nr:hypothetical protein TNCV_3574981 [Trichonephila clavipes]
MTLGPRLTRATTAPLALSIQIEHKKGSVIPPFANSIKAFNKEEQIRGVGFVTFFQQCAFGRLNDIVGNCSNNVKDRHKRFIVFLGTDNLVLGTPVGAAGVFWGLCDAC